MVLVFADGEWREWKSFNRQEECVEVVKVITHHRANVLTARCQSRMIGE